MKIGAIVNVRESTIARESDVVLPTLAGPEIGVASTKAFTCQLSVLASLAVRRRHGARHGLARARKRRWCASSSEVPRLCSQVLKLEPPDREDRARARASASDVLYLGRGTNYPIAMEGALKLKEISYIHAEGYAAGELKHGPIALIDEHMPVIVIAPHDRIFEKTVSNMQEVAARGGKIILITDEQGRGAPSVKTMETIVLPDVPEIITPMVYALPVQLLAYSHRRLHGHRRRPAAQPREIGDGGVAPPLSKRSQFRSAFRFTNVGGATARHRSEPCRDASEDRPA